MDDVVSAVNDHKPGDEITLTIFSGGQQKDVTVKLGDRPSHVPGDSSSNSP
jgi:S1-C subfamily serine protease